MEQPQIKRYLVKTKDGADLGTFDTVVEVRMFEKGWHARGRNPSGSLEITEMIFTLSDERVIQAGGE